MRTWTALKKGRIVTITDRSSVEVPSMRKKIIQSSRGVASSGAQKNSKKGDWTTRILCMIRLNQAKAATLHMKKDKPGIHGQYREIEWTMLFRIAKRPKPPICCLLGH